MDEHPLRIVICTTPEDVPRVEPIGELLRAPARRSVAIIHDEPGGLPWWQASSPHRLPDVGLSPCVIAVQHDEAGERVPGKHVAWDEAAAIA